VEDLNDMVQGMANRINHVKFKEAVIKLFENGKSFPDAENLAMAIDFIRMSTKCEFISLFTLWFKEWKEGK
jgi:hypothetical protein